MKEYSLTIIFNKERTKLLVCYNKVLQHYNFVGGKREDCDRSWLDTAYRELEEETGITRGDVTLYFIREERTNICENGSWDMTVSAGILNDDVSIIEGENPLYWLPIKGIYRLLDSDFMGYGNCYTYYLEACRFLGVEPESLYSSVKNAGFIELKSVR